MYEIISITSLGWTDGLLPSVSYAGSPPHPRGAKVEQWLPSLRLSR